MKGMSLKTPIEAGNISTNDLKTCPFFKDFTEWGIYGSKGDQFVRSHDYFRWRVLSHGIPAESLAAGANAVPQWGSSRNIDMAEECKRREDEDESLVAGEDDKPWIHSYFIQRPLAETAAFYKLLVLQINLRNGSGR